MHHLKVSGFGASDIGFGSVFQNLGLLFHGFLFGF